MEAVVPDVRPGGGEQARRNDEAVDPERPLHHPEQPALRRPDQP